MELMKKIYTLTLTFFLFIAGMGLSIAQDNPDDKKPVRGFFESTGLVDYSTIKGLPSGGLELVIQHRFGKVNNGVTDFWGIYAPSNIRMALNYGITNNLMVGIASEKNNKLQTLEWKYNLLKQNRDGSIPVDVAYYGNIGVDTRDEEVFGVNYSFTSRLSYFNQIIVARKFTDALSLLTGISYSHFNSTDSLVRHDAVAWHLGGRYKIWGSNSFIFETSMPFDWNINNYSRWDEFAEIAKPGFSFGIEFGTSTHAFQIFLSNYEQLVHQKNILYNKNDFGEGDLLLGFNVNVRF
jgi:hypothetical protein